MEYTLPNGEKVKVNDHVYCSPNWAVRDGTPYSIARIMEFLTAEGATRGTRAAKGKDAATRVRLAWYYRPSDVSDRQVTDSRLLLCAIYSEVIPVTQLRARCYVKHKDRISDLLSWKKRPDRFYYNRLFDPFIKREFEVILTSEIRNLPKQIKECLASRYDMIVTEKECVADLTDSLRLCDTCSEWCPSSESVQCDSCKSHFHMSCVQPPLVAKPARGYGWSCARCAHREEDDDGARPNPSTSVSTKPKSNNGAAPRPRGRPKGSRNNTGSPVKQQQQPEDIEEKYYKMWPFRYFGQYTVAEDTLDPEDIIFPRANTRVGVKFQTSVPSTGSSLPPPGPDIPDRGTDETVEVSSCISRMTDEELAEFETCKSHLVPKSDLSSGVDWLTESVRRFSIAYLQKQSLAGVSMKNPMRVPKWKKEEIRYCDKEWADNEIMALESTILQVGPELRTVRDQVFTRTLPEVVRYFTIWKNSRLGEENRKIIAARQSGELVLKQPSRQPSTAMSDEEKSIVDVKVDGRNGTAYTTCAACRSRQSPVWWKAPKGLSTSVLCSDCGVHWRKYGDLNLKPIKDDGLPSTKQRVAAIEKRDGTPLIAPSAKRMKLTSGLTLTPQPSIVKHITCQFCRKSAAFGKVIKCIQCSMALHAGICGTLSSGSTMDSTEAEGWLCEICQNESTLEASLVTSCVLCPPWPESEPRRKPGPVPRSELELGFLRARKPTEGQAWSHILCSLYYPEVMYTDSSRLRLVEGISSINSAKFVSDCILCNRTFGCFVKCNICDASFHPVCAFRSGFKFAFEMQGVKASKRDVTIQIDFKRDTGLMAPVVYCKSHNLEGRRLHEFCDVNERGETALQVYVKAYKQVPLDNSYGLLRKARRLDGVMAANTNAERRSISLQLSTTRCCKCNTEFSPYFHQVEKDQDTSNEQMFECHACHWERTTQGRRPEHPSNNSISVGA